MAVVFCRFILDISIDITGFEYIILVFISIYLFFKILILLLLILHAFISGFISLS